MGHMDIWILEYGAKEIPKINFYIINLWINMQFKKSNLIF